MFYKMEKTMFAIRGIKQMMKRKISKSKESLKFMV